LNWFKDALRSRQSAATLFQIRGRARGCADLNQFKAVERLRRQADRQIPTLDERPAPCTPIPTLPSISPNVSRKVSRNISRNVSRNVGPNVWRWPP